MDPMTIAAVASAGMQLFNSFGSKNKSGGTTGGFAGGSGADIFGGAGAGAGAGGAGGLFSSFLSSGNQPGWGGLAIDGLGSLGGLYLGKKQLDLSEDMFKEGKRQFNLNYAGQQKSFNSQLEDRQRARVASNAGAYESVGDYMNKYRM